MIPKVGTCVRTVEGRVEKAHIIDGRKPNNTAGAADGRRDWDDDKQEI